MTSRRVFMIGILLLAVLALPAMAQDNAAAATGAVEDWAPASNARSTPPRVAARTPHHARAALIACPTADQ